MTDPAPVGTATQPARYVFHCTLRWSDLDAYGHLNNARYLTLYEEARVALMFTGGHAWGLTSFADGVVIRRHEIDYLRPVGYAMGRPGACAESAVPTVRIETWVEEIRSSWFTLGYELFDDQVLASRASSVLVPFDLVKGQPRRLTEAEREFLLPYALPTAVITGGGAR